MLLGAPLLQEASAFALGTAAQNQRELQLHLLELQALSPLLEIASSSSAGVGARAKALYAAAALLRNCPEGQWELQRLDGLSALLDALGSGAPRLARKVLTLKPNLALTPHPSPLTTTCTPVSGARAARRPGPRAPRGGGGTRGGPTSLRRPTS